MPPVGMEAVAIRVDSSEEGNTESPPDRSDHTSDLGLGDAPRRHVAGEHRHEDGDDAERDQEVYGHCCSS